MNQFISDVDLKTWRASLDGILHIEIVCAPLALALNGCRVFESHLDRGPSCGSSFEKIGLDLMGSSKDFSIRTKERRGIQILVLQIWAII